MKKYLIASSLFLFTNLLFAQSQLLKQNNIWLEKQLNTLTKEKKDDNPHFKFSNCNADMEFKVAESGLNFGMSMGCTMDEITNITYKKENKEYNLAFDLNKKSKDDNHMSFSLKTDDEKVVKEIKKRLEENVQECKKMKK